MNAKNLSVFFLVIVILCAVFLYRTNSLFATNPVGVAIQLLAALLMTWARITFGSRSFHGAATPTTGALITNGPYKWLRHPIYASLIYFFWAGLFSHLSVPAITAVVIITAGLTGRFLIEEKFLVATYPEYAAYAAKTKRVIPFLA